ncbi:MAG: hypothetical protein U0263_12730 [Polyangiaceae bacterium]
MLLIRRALALGGAALLCAPVLAAGCGSKTGLRLGDRDAGADSPPTRRPM